MLFAVLEFSDFAIIAAIVAVLADQGPARKIAAITAYRDETGAGLADAKRAVEEYIEGRR